MKNICFSLVGMFMVSLSVQAEPLFWAGGENGIWISGGAGWKTKEGAAAVWQEGAEAVFPQPATVQIAQEGVGASSVCFEQGKTVLSGGELRLTGAAPQVIWQNRGYAEINSSCSAESGLRMTEKVATYQYEQFVTKTAALVFPGVHEVKNLAIKGYTGGEGLPNGDKRLVFQNCHDTQIDELTRSIQFQIYEGNNTKCVKLIFRDTAEGIAAQAEYAKYVGGDYVGYDFDKGGNVNSVATDVKQGAYGVSRVVAVYANDKERLSLNAGITLGSTLTVNAGKVEIGGEGVNNGIYHEKIIIEQDSRLIFKMPGSQILTGDISGSGFCEWRGTGNGQNIAYEGSLPEEFVLVAPATRLARVSKLSARMIGAAVEGTPDAECSSFVNSGTNATACFFVPEKGGMRFVRVELKQEGADICARVSAAKSVTFLQYANQFPVTDKGNVPIAVEESAPGLGLTAFTLICGNGASLYGSCEKLTGGMTIDQATVYAHQGWAIPVKSGADVLLTGKSELYLSGKGKDGFLNMVTVAPGSRFVCEGLHALTKTRKVVLDGSEMAFHRSGGDNNDADEYMDRIVMRNGARITGNTFRIGGYGIAGEIYLKVEGKGAAVVESGISLVRAEQKYAALRVEDVTEDASSDLIIQNRIVEFTGLKGLQLRKYGVGTLAIACPNVMIGDLQICEGTLRPEHPKALSEKSRFQCAGGCLQVAGFDTQTGPLQLLKESVLDLTEEGTIAFADSSAQQWTVGEMLVIKGDLQKRRVRFGTDAKGLTEEQLGMICTENPKDHLRLSDEGYLSVKPMGATVIWLR